MRYKVLSFDMFQTLVDVNAQKYTVWAEILKDGYTVEKADMLWWDTLRRLSECTKDMRAGKADFQPMRKTFGACYEDLLRENNIAMDAVLAVSILFREHGKAMAYPDAKEFFEQLNPQYRVWISSDTDREMILPLLPLFRHEHAFLSEDIGAYKQDEQGRFFRHVLQTTGVKPDEILHIGDGLTDILGAKRAGIAACWINRDGKTWEDAVKPDFTIQSLQELHSII